MPMPQSHYPPGWNKFSASIRHVRAHNRCECTGQCGHHQGRPVLHRCREINHKPALWAHGTVHLAIAHLCDCDPICMIPAHVIAACQRCHLRLDRFRHAAHRLASQSRRPEATTDIQRDIPALYTQSPFPHL